MSKREIPHPKPHSAARAAVQDPEVIGGNEVQRKERQAAWDHMEAFIKGEKAGLKLGFIRGMAVGWIISFVFSCVMLAIYNHA
jgi:hypothetical protein